MPDAPRVFISYSHDDDAHKARVLAHWPAGFGKSEDFWLWLVHSVIRAGQKTLMLRFDYLNFSDS